MTKIFTGIIVKLLKVGEIIIISAREELLKLTDENYKNFNKKICSDTSLEMLGVRIPKIRDLAKKILKEISLEDYLKISKNEYFEEVLLEGLVIAYSQKSFDEKIPFIEKFVPKIDCWAISDTFVPTLKIKQNELESAFKFITPYFSSSKEFEVRFAVIMLLDYFLIDEYIDRVIDILDKINHNGYYVKMAVAWCLAEIGIKFKSKLMKYLENSNLDNFTYNKTLQKMIESFRVSGEDKEILRKMKRKNTTSN